MNNRSTALGIGALLVAVLTMPPSAHAHALGAEAKLKEGRVFVEGYFDDDTVAADARVWVEDASKSRIAEGKMDGQGRWSFAAPPPGRYRVTVDAGAGHRATISVTIPTSASAVPAETKEATPPVTVSEGKSREEFTRFPWLQLGLGLALLGLLALALPWLMRRFARRQPRSLPEPATGEKGT